MRAVPPLVVLAIALAPAAAHANPKVLPFSYATRTIPAGELELESFVDAIPMRVARELPDGTSEAVTTPRYVLQTELELGLTDRLELGLYTELRQDASVDAAALRFQGLKQRLRYRVSEPGAWPVDVGVYLEIAEMRDELELEQKLLLERRFGPVTAIANLWIEQEWYWIDDEIKLLYNPTVGVVYEAHPAVTVGVEYWARGRFDRPDPDRDDDETRTARHYLGPTLMMQKGEYWMSLGAYARLDRLGRGAVVGDPGGSAWVRLILGIGL